MPFEFEKPHSLLERKKEATSFKILDPALVIANKVVVVSSIILPNRKRYKRSKCLIQISNPQIIYLGGHEISKHGGGRPQEKI